MSSKFWDKIAGRYDHANARYNQANERILELTAAQCGASDTVLDLGCGTGIFTVALAKRTRSVLAADFSENMLGTARRKARALELTNVTWTRADVTSLDLGPAQFDVVTAFNIFQYIRDPSALLPNIRELLKPGGRFISVTDCYGGRRTCYSAAASCLGGLGVLPRITKLSTSGLLDIVKSAGFRILVSENCYPFPPNFFIAAQKDS